jgi:hypothetical protein
MLVIKDRVQVKAFDFGSSPIRLAKKLQAAVNARLKVEAVDVNPLSQLLPSVFGNEVFEDRLKRDAMEWIVGLRLVHRHGVDLKQVYGVDSN